MFSQNFIKHLLLVLMVASCAASKPTSNSSRLRDLAANKNAKNVALLFGAENYGERFLEGVNKDISELNKVFQNPQFGFQVSMKRSATSQIIIQESKNVAASLDENSTLFWYYSGHGSEDGSLLAQDQRAVYMRDVINAMASVRKTPFKRLIVVMDSCFSGQNVDGTAAILSGTQQTSSLTHSVDAIQAALDKTVKAPGRPFEQALIIGASRANELSGDGGKQYGGIFTFSWRNVMAKMLAAHSGTIGQMLTDTATLTNQLALEPDQEGNPGQPQVPVYRASPKSILDEPLIGSGTSMPDSTTFRAGVMLTGDVTTPTMLLSVPQSIGATTVIMCPGTVEVCRKAQFEFSFAPSNTVTIAGRSIFASQAKLTLQTNTVYSMIFKSANGAEVGTQSIKVTSH